MLQTEQTDIKRMEANEMRRVQDFEKMKAAAREKKRNKQLAHRKVVARTFSKQYLANLKEHAFRNLAQIGLYHNKFKREVLDKDVVPWLYQRAFDYVQELEV